MSRHPLFGGGGAVGVAEHLPSTMAIRRSAQTPKYDCSLGPPDGENGSALTLTLRVCLIMLEPTPGHDSVKDRDGRRFRVLPWTQSDFAAYASELERSVEAVWNDKIFILLPDPKAPALSLPRSDYEAFLHKDKAIRQKHPPFLRCKLDLVTQANEAGAHAVFHVARLAPGQPLFRSYTHGKSKSGADKNLLTDRDVHVRKRTDEADLYHHTASHEVGHVLGLKHVNRQHAACVDGSEEICYGGTPYQARDIMGKGMAIDGESAGPWLRAIQQLTGHDKGWKATHLSPPLQELLSPP